MKWAISRSRGNSPLVSLLVALAAVCTNGANGFAQEAVVPDTAAARGKIVVYRLRGFLGGGIHPSIFVNGDFAGDLHLSNYLTYDASVGPVVTTAFAGGNGIGKFKFPPSPGWWPSATVCARLDWRHLSEARPDDIRACKGYIEAWTSRHVVTENYATVENKLTPALALLDAVTGAAVSVGDRPVDIKTEVTCRSCFVGMSQFEIEEGKTYYLECSFAVGEINLRHVDALTGARIVRGLRLTEHH